MKDNTAQSYVTLRSEGHRELYYIKIGGRELIFRPLTFDEYELVLDMEKHLDGPFINDTIVRIASLYCEGGVEAFLLESKAGFPDKLAESIIQVTGFQNKQLFKQKLIHKRNEATTLESIMQTTSCMAFGIKPHEWRDFTMEEQLEIFAKAEQALGTPIDIDMVLGDSAQQETAVPLAPPVPPGMESIDFLHAEGDQPDFNKILDGEETY